MNFSFIGNLVSDPVMKFGQQSGGTYCRFSVAVNTRRKSDPGNKVLFCNCMAFGTLAEDIKNNSAFKKGKAISILESSLEPSKYTDARSGVEKEGFQVKVWKVEKPVYNESSVHPPASDQEQQSHGIAEGDCPF